MNDIFGNRKPMKKRIRVFTPLNLICADSQISCVTSLLTECWMPHRDRGDYYQS